MTDPGTASASTSVLFREDEPSHTRARERLDADLIAWITVIRADGSPSSVPVWFLWHDDRILVFSEPTTVKVRAIRRGTPMQVHLDAGRLGNEIVILTGSAAISETDASGWLPEIGERYARKYAEAMVDYGMDLEPIAEKFSTVIVVTPEKLTAW